MNKRLHENFHDFMNALVTLVVYFFELFVIAVGLRSKDGYFL